MTVKEYLKTAPDDRLFYLGADTGFLTAGTKKDLVEQFPELNIKCEEQNTAQRAKAEETYKNNLEKYGAKDRKTLLMRKRLDKFPDFQPLEDRKILDIYDRASEEATNIKVTGCEIGTMWSIHEGEADWGKIDLECNIEELAGAIIRGLVNGYNLTLTMELKKYEQCIKMLEDYRAHSKKWEDFIGSYDVIAMSGLDPHYIIEETRRTVCRQLEEAKKHDADLP